MPNSLWSTETLSPVTNIPKAVLNSTDGEKIHNENKAKLITSWLWPQSKPMDFSNPNIELANLGYTKFYTGKNADLYIVPWIDPIRILMLRTDRTSVFNIPLDLEVKWKGEVQTQISKFGAKFAEEHWIKTAYFPLNDIIPQSLRDRCQITELCTPVEIEIDWEKQGLELIFRNYITGSLWKAYTKWGNPYWIELPQWLQEWNDIRINGKAVFTPTDKTKDDNPLNSQMVEDSLKAIGYGDIVPRLQQLFAEFSKFCYERGYILVDTKFEVFKNSIWEWVIGDEMLTPESSRFIKRSDFESGKYISADKQYIRELGKQFGWEQKWQELKTQNEGVKFLSVSHEVTDDMRNKVVQGYTDIWKALTS